METHKKEGMRRQLRILPSRLLPKEYKIIKNIKNIKNINSYGLKHLLETVSFNLT